MFTASSFIISSSIISKPLYIQCKKEAWLAVVLAIIISLPVMWIYASLAKRFPGKSLIEINEAVLGRFLGSVISALYILFFLSLAVFNTRDIGSFIKGFIMTNTPVAVIIIMFVFICALAVRKGAIIIARLGALIAMFSIVIVFLNSMLLTKSFHLENMLPLFQLPLINYILAAHTATMIPFLELFAFFMFAPDLNESVKFGKSIMQGLLLGAAVLLFIVVRDTVALGALVNYSASPSFAVIRLIDIGDILTRVEILYAVLIITLNFFKVSILYSTTVTGISRLLKFESYNFLISTIGALIIICALSVFKSSFEASYWISSGAAPMYATLFLLILPGLTLLVAALRGLSLVKRKTSSDV